MLAFKIKIDLRERKVLRIMQYCYKFREYIRRIQKKKKMKYCIGAL